TEGTGMAELCVRSVLQHFGREGMGAKVVTRSQIPISKGLKSSSCAANAIIKATLKALGEDMPVLQAVKMGCECAKQAGVSVTGAFDDACASMLGGVVLTDNLRYQLIERERMDDSLAVLIHVPDYQIRKGTLPLERIRAQADLVGLAYILASRGQYRTAMKLNGIIYASVLGVDPAVMHEAMAKGAVAAGLSGTGPATVILAPRETAESLKSSLSVAKDIMITDIFNCD
ncbi:MAG TPA: shikimate kinase, partial [Methanomassiliicoccales archaeon]|nr:shikimate kinase [Methanomassiliicoccales archaeon]